MLAEEVRVPWGTCAKGLPAHSSSKSGVWRGANRLDVRMVSREPIALQWPPGFLSKFPKFPSVSIGIDCYSSML